MTYTDSSGARKQTPVQSGWTVEDICQRTLLLSNCSRPRRLEDLSLVGGVTWHLKWLVRGTPQREPRTAAAGGHCGEIIVPACDLPDSCCGVVTRDWGLRCQVCLTLFLCFRETTVFLLPKSNFLDFHTSSSRTSSSTSGKTDPCCTCVRHCSELGQVT